MATVNRINLSSHRVDGAMPRVRAFRPASMLEGARIIDDAGRHIVDSANQSLAMINRIKENDAHIVATQWHNAMLDALNGSTITNPDGSTKQIPGIAAKTWQDYDGSDRSPITDLADAEKAFQSTPAFKNMDAITLKKFERIVSVDRARFQATVNGIYDRNSIERDKFWDAKAIESFNRELKSAMFGDDEAFDRLNAETALKIVETKFKRFNPDDEKVEAAKKQDYTEILNQNARSRVAALAADAAANPPRLVEGKLVTNADSLAKADEYLNKLLKSGQITPEDATDLRYKIIQGKAIVSNREQEEIRRFANAALVRANEKDGLRILENAELTLANIAAGLEKDSQAQTVALDRSQALGKAADKLATEDILNDLISGRNIYQEDGKTTIFNPASRQARCLPDALAKFKEFEKRSQATNDTELRYSEAALDHMIQSGEYPSEQIEYMKRTIFNRATAMSLGRRLTPEDIVAFNTRWNARTKADESQAAVEFDRAFGVSFELKDDGSPAKDVNTLVKNSGEYRITYPGQDESVKMREYLKMRSAFLRQLRILPPNADRVAETKRLLDSFKSGWFANRTAENIEDMTRQMVDIHNEIEARYLQQRLQEEAERRQRTMPIVSKEHPDYPDRQDKENPLDFYKAPLAEYFPKNK